MEGEDSTSSHNYVDTESENSDTTVMAIYMPQKKNNYSASIVESS